MIRFRLAERIATIAAALCDHPKLARLREFGPWQATGSPDGVILTRTDAIARTDWGPWHKGLDGLEYAVPDPLPPFVMADWLRKPAREGILVTLRCGATVPVAPSYLDGAEIMLDGSVAGPVNRYSRLVSELWDRTATGPIGPTDPTVLEFARLAVSSCLRLPPEATHAWHLLATSDIQPLFDAATSLPKAEAGARA